MDGHDVTVTNLRDGRWLVACNKGCDLGTSRVADTEEEARARGDLHVNLSSPDTSTDGEPRTGLRVLLVVPVVGVPHLITGPVTLDVLKREVGGWIEHVGINDRGDAAYCNEEGKILGLPINTVATELAAALGWAGAVGDVLCGPVVFCTDGPDGTDGSVSDRALDAVGLA